MATQYERNHPVEKYRFYDWNVWPLIREETTLSAMTAQPFPHIGKRKNHTKVFKEFLKQFLFLKFIISTCIEVAVYAQNSWRTRSWHKDWTRILKCDPRNNDNHLASDRDVLILTLSDRRLQSTQGFYEIFADPLVETFHKMGVSTIVWERGEERYPRSRPSAWISRLIDREMRREPDLPRLKEPLWFEDFAPFTASVLGREKSWFEIESSIRYVQKLSIIFEKWLKQTGVKLLISVCWYGSDVMAATLAAKRLGIVSVDLQHGMQGEGHDAYYGWEKTPASGYELVPDVFLCWGHNQVKNLLEYNKAFRQHSEPIIGGNLWLNKWRYSDCSLFDFGRLEQLAKQTAAYTKTILVSLQSGKEHFEFIINVLQHSPDKYFWLLRLHPATSLQERLCIESELTSLSKTNFEYKLSSQLALYALFKLSDSHITGHSTTAHEALAFGIPTITFTTNGANAYREFIASGTIFYAENANQLYQVIESCQKVAGFQCKNSVKNYFAPQNISEDGIHHLLSIAGINSNTILS